MRPSILAFLCFALCRTVAGQSLQTTAFNTADSVIVRWAPSSVQAWERFNRYGCRIERVDVSTPERKVQRLNADTLKPMSLGALKQHLAANSHAPIIAQALHGDDIRPNTGDVRAQMDAADQATMRWSLCALYADIDPEIADALGYRWVDKNVSATGYYLYRVITLDPQQADTAMIAIDRKDGAHTIPHGPALNAQEKEHTITLRWEREQVKSSFSAFWIERRQGTGAWQRLNDVPFVPMDNERGAATHHAYTDTTITRDYVPYQYRVLGITPFGMISSEAPVVTAMGRDRTAPPNPVMRRVNDEQGKLVVYWDQPGTTADLKGFRVEKTYHTNAAYQPLHRDLLPPSTRQFTDTSSFLIGENHFRVWAVDTAGNASVSLSGYGVLADSVAPAPPIGLKGSIDTAGVVTVHWPWGKERDLLGYRVFFANAADHNFNNLSPEPQQDTVFHDTIPLRTLTKHIYYKVVAVDRNFNHSPLSAVLHLVKPDQVAPVAPVIERYAVNDSAVVIHFIPSSSDDVARHVLLRRSPVDTTWREVVAWNASEQPRTWTDRTVTAAAAYTYLMQAVDSAGNRSPRSVPLEVRIPQRPEHPSAEAVKAVVVDDVIQVSWVPPTRPVKHYVIYRSKNGAMANTVGSAGSDATTFADVRVPGNGSYRYAVKAVYADGGSSRIVEMPGLVEVR